MSKYLGMVTLYDLEGLEEIAQSVGFSTNLTSDLPYLDPDAVWHEEAEVRLDGLDYIEVYRGVA